MGMPTHDSSMDQFFDAARDESLRQVASERLELPRLVSEPPGWFDEFFESISEFFADLFPKVSSVPGFNGSLIFWTLVFIAAAIFVYLIYCMVVAFDGSDRKFKPLSTQRRMAKLAYEDQLQAALNQGDMEKAARLRWSLFLRRCQLPTSQTPLETGLSLNTVQSADRLMFFQGNKALYQSFDEFMTSEERSRS